MSIYYPLTTETWDRREYESIERVIESNRFTMGPEVHAFEREFADFHGLKYAVMVNSGSSANLLMIAAMFYRKQKALRPGQEVVVPAVSWSTTYMPLQQFGLKCVFVDVDVDTLNMSVDDVRRAISSDTAAVLAVNLLGNPCEWDGILQLCEDYDLVPLEDNCESLGARIGGGFTGTFGLMGTFSFFYSHHISTMEGGMIVTDDEELYHVLLSLRAHGWTRELPLENEICSKSNNPFFESFRFILPGYNLRPLEFSGAIGREQLKKLPAIIKGRRDNAEYFHCRFAEDDRFRIQREHGDSSWFGFSLIVKDGRLNRNDLVQRLSRAGIECRPIVAGNFLKNDAIKYFNWSAPARMPGADVIHENGFFVGNGHEDLTQEIDYFVETLNALYQKNHIRGK